MTTQEVAQAMDGSEWVTQRGGIVTEIIADYIGDGKVRLFKLKNEHWVSKVVW
jgi:hypothetical protein